MKTFLLTYLRSYVSDVYFFFGGLLQLLAGVLEWIIGNTHPSVVFTTFVAFFLTLGATLSPNFAAYASYAPIGEDPTVGLETQGFNASFGTFLLYKCLSDKFNTLHIKFID